VTHWTLKVFGESGLWNVISAVHIAANSFVTRYKLLTERPIPVVVLRPQARA
jgi:hypothetical protein